MISENCVYAEKKKLIASLEYDEALLKSNTQELKALDHKKQLLEKQAELEMINASRKRAQQYEDALACKRQNAIDYQNQRARYNNTMQDDYFDQKRRQQLYHSEMQLQETIKDNTNNREIKLIMARAETTSNLIRSSHEHINLATLMVNRSNNNNLSSSTVQSGAYYNNIGNFHQSTLNFQNQQNHILQQIQNQNCDMPEYNGSRENSNFNQNTSNFQNQQENFIQDSYCYDISEEVEIQKQLDSIAKERKLLQDEIGKLTDDNTNC